MYRILFFVFLLLSSLQLIGQTNTFSRADTLRGLLTPLRTCYNIDYYHLDVRVDIEQKAITGSNLFRFTATTDFSKLQFDLFENLTIEKILYKNEPLKYTREFNAVFVEFPETIPQHSQDEFTVYYSGRPVVAKNAPWDGGFIFSKDGSGKPWVAVACQGLGASAWWPCKDHQADKVDSMLISVSVPNNLVNISNGRLQSVNNLPDGYLRYNWLVSYPINNYNVTLNIGDYRHISDSITGLAGKLSLDYYVLRENFAKAKKYFEPDVQNTIRSFEHWFGPYPFYRDGYKLVESPYLGMEHQSAISYGNEYKKGYKGNDLSGTGFGKTWDYIIVHESAHEWFGNNITSKDVADMWIHESFTTYAEGVFVEWIKDKTAGAKYIKGLRKNILNDVPIIGTYNVDQEGSGDMYYKGANMLHGIRTLIDDDERWRQILTGLNSTFGLKTTTTEEVINFINTAAGKNFSSIFDQYLRYTDIPILEVRRSGKQLEYRWKASVKNFDMPIRIKLEPSAKWIYIYPNANWQTLKNEAKIADIIVDTDNFYIKTRFLQR